MRNCFEPYREYPYFDLHHNCGCNPCHNPFNCFPYFNLPNCSPNCNKPNCSKPNCNNNFCPPLFPPMANPKQCSNDELLFLLTGILIGKRLD